MNGYDMEMWRIQEHLINWDTLFAFGFTSYQAYQTYSAKHTELPIDSVREILLRLYMIEPEFPRLFSPPSINEFLDFVFNIDESDPAVEDDRKRCIALLAPILGRNRGSGYRWLRSKEHADNPVALPIRRLTAKVYSMDQATARLNFWKAALATAHARGLTTATVTERLKAGGVQFG